MIQRNVENLIFSRRAKFFFSKPRITEKNKRAVRNEKKMINTHTARVCFQSRRSSAANRSAHHLQHISKKRAHVTPPHFYGTRIYKQNAVISLSRQARESPCITRVIHQAAVRTCVSCVSCVIHLKILISSRKKAQRIKIHRARLGFERNPATHNIIYSIGIPIPLLLRIHEISNQPRLSLSRQAHILKQG